MTRITTYFLIVINIFIDNKIKSRTNPIMEYLFDTIHSI